MITFYDKLVSDWLDPIKRKALVAADPFFALVKNLEDHGMPEPYFGDPENCTAVIINLNPGQTISTNDYAYRSNPDNVIYQLTNKYGPKYSDFARPFPYLSTSVNSANKSKKWWLQREDWIKRLLSAKGEVIINNDKKPFAVELCPWHSKHWQNPSKWDTACMQRIKDYAFDPMSKAIPNSDLGFGIVVGKSIYSTLLDLGWKEVYKCGVDIVNKARTSYFSGPITQKLWPTTINGDLKARMYAILEHPEYKIKVLCTWHQGGNMAPSKEYSVVEKEICKLI